MIGFIDDHRAAYGVEPICRVLPIAPSTYHAHAVQRADPSRRSARAQRDAALQADIQRVWEANFRVYGVRKVWRQLRREAIVAPRCQVARLMKRMGLAGAVRGRTVRTTISNLAAPCPLDRVNRKFRALAPNVLWVSDFTYVATVVDALKCPPFWINEMSIFWIADAPVDLCVTRLRYAQIHGCLDVV
jgi:putative transposase